MRKFNLKTLVIVILSVFVSISAGYAKEVDTTPPVITDMKPVLDTRAGSDKPVISARWKDDKGLNLSSASLILDNRKVTKKAEISKEGIIYQVEEPLKKGVHTVEIRIKDKAGNLSNKVRYCFSVGEQYTTVVKIGKDKRCRINGELFFPIGNRGYDFKPGEMARAGYNFAFGGTAPDPAQTRGFDKKQKDGLKYLGDFPAKWYKRKPEGLNKTIEALKSSFPFYQHPAFLAYSLHEINSRPGGIKFATAFYEVIKKYGHNRPAIWLLNAPSRGFGKVSDGIHIDCYPVPTRPISQVARYVDAQNRMMDYKKPVWFCVQVIDFRLIKHPYYPIPKGKEKRQVLDELRSSGFTVRPTVEEVKCMTYLAITHGALGINFWKAAGGPRRINIADFPEAWEGVKKIAGELRHLSPVFLAPDSQEKVKVIPKGLPIHTMIKEYEGKTYLIAVNGDEKLMISPTFILPKGRYSNVKVLFENRVLKIKGNQFRDIFKPIAVHIYCID